MKFVIAIFVLILVYVFFMAPWECVRNRAQDGTPTDWATVKDCLY